LLKLKKVQILGFKSFCDRTEVQLTGEGIAAVVGPNGCGKSNISDAITWVLGEQSAKSLRGIKMEDVIFAGTRERKPTGMAEVSLTLVDPEVYDGMTLPDGEIEAGDWSSDGSTERALEAGGDWDETKLRELRAMETEEAVAEAQPGVVLEGEEGSGPRVQGGEVAADGVSAPDPAHREEAATNGAPGVVDGQAATAAPGVVLKIRRRKFGRAPVRAGEITVTRRLFRSGESEYLLNGKICRLRDIQDIFMGTGLGGESYAIIGQERIGQILSSKPMDRRAILEEAAGITRFKTKKRLAELRLESAKQNLSRVNDIFDEVTRQMGTLKRQAAKAERYGVLRDELRGKLRIVLASRLTQMDAERAELSSRIEALGAQVAEQAAAVEAMDAEHTAGVRTGYELDQQIREAGARANQSAVELERTAARIAANTDRVAELTARVSAGEQELGGAREHLAGLAGELESQKSFLENATTEAQGSRAAAAGEQARAQEAVRAVGSAEAKAEESRRAAMQLMQRAAATRNEQAQAEAALGGLEREAERLAAESDAARRELQELGVQRGQVAMSFGDVTERLKRLEGEIGEIRLRIEAARAEESSTKRRADQLRAERATLTGRRDSLDGLIREHSYSTDTVKNLFRVAHKRAAAEASATGGLAPVGTLADFLEVEGQYESVVDEFLRDELNYVVVKSWDAADVGVRMLQSDVAGRATFLVHGDAHHEGEEVHAHAGGGDAAGSGAPARVAQHTEGVVALKDCVKALNGFGNSLEHMLPKLRDGYIVPDSGVARKLSEEHPRAYFLSPAGETFHNATVTGGRVRAQGPLALKRELSEIQGRLEKTEAELGQAELKIAGLDREVRELQGSMDRKTQERREAERESANSGAALRQMESEIARIERRLQEWTLGVERNRDQQNQRREAIERKRQESARFEEQRAGLEAQLAEIQERLNGLRGERERVQQAAAEAAAALAGLEERRRNAASTFEQTSRMVNGQQQRIAQIEQTMQSAGAERVRREEETAQLAAQHEGLVETRASAVADGARLTDEAKELRARMAEVDGKLRTLRHETEALREERAGLSARAAKLASDIEHLEATCVNDLSVEASALREDAGIARIDSVSDGGQALQAAEEEARGMKQRLEAMGPVNMMALEEYKETAERHGFLETQRRDLMESIENTQASIKEIDDVSRVKFEEAFKVINENFGVTFAKLFGGGQAFMKLTDEENAAESGIDIVASPPGKKLQNILLLSGGEKALTALSLLVGIFQFQPAPFCVLDEVDAPLDETNVGRFAKLIADMSATTQFIVITHSKRTMAQADVIYGVTMQEPGVSKVVSVSLSRRESERERRAVA
jgi:chromosome segregation protein